VNLYGQELLLALRTDPEAARRDLGVINDVLVSIHRWYLSVLNPAQLQPIVADFRTQPRGRGQLCGCTCHLVSGADYRDFIAPLDRSLLAAYPRGGMIHLCGSHTQHIPAWREMKELAALQMNDRAAHDLESYFSGTRPDQILYVNPCEGMPVRRILEITGGRRTVIVAQPEDP
jgi:hypothetical protein